VLLENTDFMDELYTLDVLNLGNKFLFKLITGFLENKIAAGIYILL
jgi:hypothetical protein